jgi:hypothetical protein
MITLAHRSPRAVFVVKTLERGSLVAFALVTPDIVAAVLLVLADAIVNTGQGIAGGWRAVNDVAGDVYTAGWVVIWIVRAIVTPLERG